MSSPKNRVITTPKLLGAIGTRTPYFICKAVFLQRWFYMIPVSYSTCQMGLEGPFMALKPILHLTVPLKVIPYTYFQCPVPTTICPDGGWATYQTGWKGPLSTFRTYKYLRVPLGPMHPKFYLGHTFVRALWCFLFGIQRDCMHCYTLYNSTTVCLGVLHVPAKQPSSSNLYRSTGWFGVSSIMEFFRCWRSLLTKRTTHTGIFCWFQWEYPNYLR